MTNTSKYSAGTLSVAVLLFLAIIITGAAIAEEPSPAVATDDGSETDRIHITADRLIVETGAETAEFIGNVTAAQGDTVITGDRLKIFYKSGAEAKGAATTTAANLKKIVADGHVTIKLDDRVAVTDKAVYITETEVLMLTGPNSKITSEKNSVSGDKITLYRTDNRMVVDGSSKERVEAILFTKDKGIK